MHENPVIYLTAKLWKYSKGNRHNVVLYFVLLICANITTLLEPLVIGKLFNTIQERGVTQESFPILLGYLFTVALITPVFWAFHGPARLVEMKNAFWVRANYKKYLLDGVMAFPLEWHTDHHSGDTIDKVEKGTQAMYRYAGDTFEIIQTAVRLIGSYIVLVYFNVHAAYIVFFIVALTISAIVQFDKVLVRQYRVLFRAENKISAKIFDVISNITTVI